MTNFFCEIVLRVFPSFIGLPIYNTGTSFYHALILRFIILRKTLQQTHTLQQTLRKGCYAIHLFPPTAIPP